MTLCGATRSVALDGTALFRSWRRRRGPGLSPYPGGSLARQTTSPSPAVLPVGWAEPEGGCFLPPWTL